MDGSHRSAGSLAGSVAHLLFAACVISMAAVALAATDRRTVVPKACLGANEQLRVECSFYPKVAKPRVFAGPDGTERYVDPRFGGRQDWSFPFGNFAADPSDLHSGSGRVRLYDRWSSLVVWVERDDIVPFSALRKVKGGWPMRRLEIINGDSEAGVIEFKPDGSGVVSNQGTRKRVQAWHVQGVYSVREVGPAARYSGLGSE
jgi:hypothetical protein